MILGRPIIALLFQRGAFTQHSTILTGQALLAYCLGLWAFAAVRILVPTFYSLKDTRTPFLISLVAVGANIVLNLILMIPLKHAGLALATSISAMLNLALLTWFLRRKIGPLGLKAMAGKMVKPALATAVMGLFCLALMLYFGDVLETLPMVRLKIVLTGVVGGGVIYFALAKIMGTEELEFILGASGLSRGGDPGEGET